jgi:hypothetical protein
MKLDARRALSSLHSEYGNRQVVKEHVRAWWRCGQAEEYVAVLSYYDGGGRRRQKRRTASSFSEAKRIRRELEQVYLEGGEVALCSDDLTFEALANHCKQTKYCEAEYDEVGNKLFGAPLRELIATLGISNPRRAILWPTPE